MSNPSPSACNSSRIPAPCSPTSWRGTARHGRQLSATYRAQTHPYAGSVAVPNETFAVALQSTNQVFHPDAAAFSSQASAQNYIANTVAANPSLAGTLHVIPGFEVAA